MSHARKVSGVAVLIEPAWAMVPLAEAQARIRIGAALAQTGGLALATEAASPAAD